MLDVKVQVNRKEVEKLIKEMDLFPTFKETVKAYRDQEDKLYEREQLLKKQLDDLQNAYTKNLLDQETASVSDLIYLKIQAKKMVEEIDIIKVLLEEVKQEFIDLKFAFYPKYRDALNKDSYSVPHDVTPVIIDVISQVLTVISEVGQESKKQYGEIYPDIVDMFQDKHILERYPRLLDTMEQYSLQRYTPQFKWNSQTVLEKNEVISSTSGSVPTKFKVKEVKTDE